MNYQDIAKRFEEANSGSESFKKLFKDAFLTMKSDPENACLYFVVGVAARAYVRKYEDQAISAEFADHTHSIFVGYNAKICEALASDPATRLRLLSEVAIDYEWNVISF